MFNLYSLWRAPAPVSNVGPSCTRPYGTSSLHVYDRNAAKYATQSLPSKPSYRHALTCINVLNHEEAETKKSANNLNRGHVVGNTYFPRFEYDSIESISFLCWKEAESSIILPRVVCDRYLHKMEIWDQLTVRYRCSRLTLQNLPSTHHNPNMPMLYHLSMSAITFLSLHREVGSNASDIVTNNVFALNLTTYPLLDKATSSSPIHENPDNFGFDGLHREDLRSEERAGLLPQRVSAYVYKLRMGVSSRLLLHPKRVMKTCGIEAKTKGRIGVHDFWRWLEYVDLYRARGKQFSDSALVDVLVKKSIPEAQLVNLFHSLRFYREMEDRANVFQRILAQKCSPATSEYMISVWLQSNLNPRDVFRILGNGWRDINVSSPSVILWLRYTEAFRIKNGGDAYPVEQTGEDLFLQRYTLAQSLTFLEKARQEQDLVQLANELEEYVNEHTHALPKLLAAAA